MEDLKLKSIEFNEDQLGNLHELAEALFHDENDPTSYRYKRILIRPQINWRRIILNCVIPLLLIVALFIVLNNLGIQKKLSLIGSLVLLLLYIFIRAKAILICLIHIYQRYSPDSIRNKCRFEPSCSQYMIIALKKHGLYKGLKKGIGRLKRCNINDGGYDFP